ncbi:hypothetical protein CASFOL_041812 [Castilleja foliolosa]|uniref:C2 domain-containing protein n=1 Tax=Castilleja foliolosa TaxID=1961234 RepID=A0ABD3B8Q7_9LAMI
MGSITDATILHHVCIVLLMLWFLNSFNYCNSLAYFLSLIYLYLVHEGYVLKLRKKLQFEEKREYNQRRVLLESETVRWLNHAVEKMWLVCMEEIVSQKILLPLFPWFLNKYKPWTVKDVEVQHLYLGRAPPIIIEMRVVQHCNSDDHLVLELGMNFRTADDMSAILGVKLRKRLGFGISAKLHLLGIHVEGKVLVGVKFMRGWPFISRLRVCFAGPPYFQMTVKPIFSHGLDVTEFPGIAGWIDNLLALVIEQTLVEPNMLVVDVEKFASPQSENWFSVDAKEPIAHVTVEVLEASEMKPSNGLADPYVKGQLGPYRFRTKTQKRTLSPKWREEFKIPICSWESENMLLIEVRDKDRIFDDTMGDCCVNINELMDGQRHDIWLPLENIKTGRLHLAVTVSDGTGKKTELNRKLGKDVCLKVKLRLGLCCGHLICKRSCKINYVAEPSNDAEIPDSDIKKFPITNDSAQKDLFTRKLSEKSAKVADKFDPIDIEGKPETGIWIHHPGSETAQMWEPRKGKTRHKSRCHVNGLVQDDGSSTDEESAKSPSKVRRGLRKIGSVFRKSPKDEDKSGLLGEPGIRWVTDGTFITPSLKDVAKEGDEGNGPGSPKAHVKDVAKSFLKKAGKSARDLKSVLSWKVSRKSIGESTDKDGSSGRGLVG